MNNTQPMVIACSKGYLWDESISLLKGVGIHFDDHLDQSRQLSTTDQSGLVTLMKVRPWDVPVYVEQGAADIGIVGKDVIVEQMPDIIECID